jgi:predicted HTH transcriptional regulator
LGEEIYYFPANNYRKGKDLRNIKELIKMPESKTLEFKQDISPHEKIVKTIIAFANSAGGKIIIGIDDNRNVIQRGRGAF